MRGPRPVTYDGLQSDTRGSAVDFGAVGSNRTSVDGALVARLTKRHTAQPYTCEFRIRWQMNLAFAIQDVAMCCKLRSRHVRKPAK